LFILGPRHQHANAAKPLGLLRMSGERARRRPGKNGDELAPP
jgi:hypothetical protein